MRSGNFTDEFKRDAVAQIAERGYPVAGVSQRLWISQHSLYAWRRKFAKPSGSPNTVAEAAPALALCAAPDSLFIPSPGITGTYGDTSQSSRVRTSAIAASVGDVVKIGRLRTYT